jgi:hypothetical protein
MESVRVIYHHEPEGWWAEVPIEHLVPASERLHLAA